MAALGQDDSNLGEVLRANPRVITPLHVRIMQVVGRAADDFDGSGIRLEGGTALAAYHLFHRESEDLDFFATSDLSVPAFIDFLSPRLEPAGLVCTTRRAAVRSFGELHVGDSADVTRAPVKVQFALTSPFQLAPLDRAAEGILVGSYRDLCVCSYRSPTRNSLGP